MNVLIISPVASAYDVLTDFSDQLFHAVRKINPSTFQYLATKEQSIEQIIDELQEICRRCEISHVVSFNGVGLNLFETIQTDHIKFIGWLVDYPNYHFGRLNSALKSKHFLTSNPNHASFIHDLTSSQHAGVLTLGTPDLSKLESPQEMTHRDFDVIFIGSWMGFPEKFWQKINDPLIQKIAKHALDLLHADDRSDPYLILKNAFIENGLDIPKNAELINALITRINDFNRKYMRLKMMNAVAQSGLKTLVVGNGWSDHFALPHLYFHEPVPNHLIDEIYEKCKIVVCLNSNNGGCERALQALSSGCSVFSFGGIPIEKMAKDTDQIYLCNSWENETVIAHHLRAALAHIMNSKDSAADIVDFQQKHSWDQASIELLQIIESLDSVELSH